MSKILVIYYSRTGNTEKMAKAIAEGIKEDKVDVKVKRCDYANVEDVIESDGIAFGSPTYFGYMAGVLKDFFDRSLEFRKRISGKKAVAFASAGSNGEGCLESIENMINAFGMEKAKEGVISTGIPGDKELDACRDLGRVLAKSVK